MREKSEKNGRETTLAVIKVSEGGRVGGVPEQRFMCSPWGGP